MVFLLSLKLLFSVPQLSLCFEPSHLLFLEVAHGLFQSVCAPGSHRQAFRLRPAGPRTVRRLSNLSYLFVIQCSQWKLEIRKTVPAMCNQTHVLMKSKSCQVFLLYRGEAVFNTCFKVHFCKLVFLSVSLSEPHMTVLGLLDMDGWIRETVLF